MFGFDRSGTTLLSMMMGAHPQLAVPFSQAGLWFRYESLLPRYNKLATKDDVSQMVTDLLAEERIQLWDVKLEYEEIVDGLPLGDFASIVERFHATYAARKGKPHWGNIDIATLDHMDQVNRWFRQARFIHIVRDGRDVALSHETYPYGASNTLECAMEWRRRLEANMKMGSMLDPARYMVVRYEDLILESELTLRGLCRFVGVEYAPEMLEYDRMVPEKIPAAKKWLWPAIDRRPVTANAYRWPSRMSVSKRVVFEWNARDLLARLGYETFERPPKLPRAYMLELWYFLGRGGRFKRLKSTVRPSALKDA
jgi:hypothetical protein